MLFIAMIGTTIGAFWLLLGCRYSPETYKALPITLGTVELVWCGLSFAAAVVCVVWLLKQGTIWRSAGCAAAPLTLVSLVIVTKALLGASLRCYDMILFCTAFGWTIMSVAKKVPLFFDEAASRGIASAQLLSLIVWISASLLSLFYFWQQVHYWKDLALGYADCAEYARLLNNTVYNPRELFMSANPEKPMFWGHFEPGILLFAPLWALWPDLKMIFALQVVVIVGVSLPLYWIGRRVFRERVAALLLVAAWLVYPSASQLIYSASYGFHFGNVCLPLYFLALAFWLDGRSRWALAAAAWALLMKEEAAIVMGMFGLYVAIFERRLWLGTAITVTAFGYFLVVTTLIIPPVRLGHYELLRFFDDLGHSKWEIFLSPLTRPRIFWGKLFEARSFYFAAALLAPLLFYPLRKPHVLCVGLLTFVFDCLYPALKSICYHYQAALLPVVFWALACALQHKQLQARRAALLGVIGSGAMISIFLGNMPYSKDTLPIKTWPGRLDLVRRFGAQIDPHGTLFTTARVGAHFVTQRYLYLEPPVPKGTDYALLDLRDSWRGAAASLDWLRRVRNIQRQVEAIPALHLVGAADGLLFYSRRGAPLDAQTLVERDQLPEEVNLAGVDLDGVRIVGFTVAALPREERRPTDRVRVTTFSTVTTPTNLDLAAQCMVHAGRDPASADSYLSESQPLGQGIWPIARWETNKLYADDFIIQLPAGLAGEIDSVSFHAVVLSPTPERR